MAGNETSRRCWAYQTAVGTEAIDEAIDVTYLLGHKGKDEDWKIPTIKTPVSKYYSYNSREPTLTPLEPQYKTFMTPFIPTTAQHLVWMLKQVTEDGVSANVHLIEALDSGLPLPITLRTSLLEGSVDRIFQAVDAYCIGLYWRAMLGSQYFVECEWAFGRLEDKRGQWKADDTVAAVAGDVITLTDEPQRAANYYQGWLVYVSGGDQEDEEFTVSSSDTSDPPKLTLSSTPDASINGDSIKLFDKERPVLTTVPVMPGESALNAYMGAPEVYWDVADQNVALPECWKVECSHQQNYTTVLDENSKYQIVYLHEMQPLILTMEMVCEKHKQVYDYIDRKANQINVKVYKPNTNYYILHKLIGCEIVDWEETGHANKGYWNARVFLEAASFQGNFTLESESNWSTHYKHV